MVATIGSAAGITAIFKRPLRPCLSALMSWRIARASPTMRRCARPFQGAFAFRRQPDEARSALHQHHAEHLLELLEADRQRRLRYVTRLGGPAEMLFLRKCKQIFQLVDHYFPAKKCSARDARRNRFFPLIEFVNRSTKDQAQRPSALVGLAGRLSAGRAEFVELWREPPGLADQCGGGGRHRLAR